MQSPPVSGFTSLNGLVDEKDDPMCAGSSTLDAEALFLTGSLHHLSVLFRATFSQESLANVTHEHISSLRKFWEGLMTQDNLNEVRKRPPRRPIQLPSAFTEESDVSKFQAANGDDDHSSSHPSIIETADLPPPPATVEEKCHDAMEPSLPELSAELPPPPPDVEADLAEDVHSKSIGCIDAQESPSGQYFVPKLPSTTQPEFSHDCYKRPHLGASALSSANITSRGPYCQGVLRNWPTSITLNESPSKVAVVTSQSTSTLPRERSVTFEAELGSAPGDTEYEESEADDIVSSHSPTSYFVGREREYNDMPGESIGILESAARLANSAERYDRASRRRSQDSGGSCAAAVESDVFRPADDGSLTEASDEPHYPADESVSVDDEDDGVESVNSEPVIGRMSVSVRGSKKSLIASPLKGRKSGEAGSRRISREASALLDFDCPPTPINEDRRLSRTNTQKVAAEEAALSRRTERLREISDLLVKENVLILELGASLEELQTRIVTTTTTSAAINKSSSKRHHVPIPVDMSRLINLNVQFLLAYQRRQCLLDEMGILQLGSKVLVPPMRGEPLRARFQLSAIRLALKSDGVNRGYAVFGSDAARPQVAEENRPIKYHLIAIMNEVVTLVRLADLPTGCARPAPYVDLPASIDIVPLRPDFVIKIEVYCLQTGSEQPPTSCTGFHTPVPKSSRTSSSIALSPPAASSALGCFGIRNPFSSSKSSKKNKYRGRGPPLKSSVTDPSAAFTLLSSVQIHHTDDLLYGRYPPTGGNLFSNISKVAEDESDVEMPLLLTSLPRSAPLTGRLGMCDVAVRLQSSVLKRGFLTIFDESGGMGVWMRCWCKLTADQLVYWRYPEDEMAPSSGGGKPVGRLDMRCVVAPWAVEAPRKICVRANCIYIRSLISINCDMMALMQKDMENCNTKSIRLHASSDNRWMEERHLMCADSQAEMESWVKEVNRGVEALQQWMPEHFSRLARYDATLTFSEPVSAKFATRIKCCPAQ
ncbi:hypothetical protein Aperf_G00000115059 [Anoplocephala perfoliata]